ncbi:MAG TPA: DEAD/DEAH box helicase [Candidatus Thermoplasmatota archaeon]|nr:DEAD/DEAH box helicase [Candidatus Thermoplasmatota archaeon]
MVQFDSFNLPQPILRALADMGFTEPSPIQEAAIPILLTGRDVIGQAKTGTGKTAAFGIALVVAALEGKPSLVLVPTRELAQQVTAEIDRIGAVANIRALALYGGASFGEQARALERGEADILVATPGRLRDHISRGTLKASVAKLVVLDEADEMLKMGFIDEVEEILKAVGDERQTVLFSATVPEPIQHLAERYMREPEFILAEATEEDGTTEQLAVAVTHNEKIDTLVRIFAVERPTGALIFRHTRETVEELAQQLRPRGIRAEALHGGMSQNERDSVLARLREGELKVVVATNVAARGLDVDTISHVVNYDAPRETEAYVHRIGRTGRAGRTGRSFLFVTPADRGRLRGIERVLGGRLDWYQIPTDADVAQALARHTAEWLDEQKLDATPEHRAIVAGLVEKGADPVTLAAKLLGLVAKHEGLRMPQLEPRRQQQAYAQNEGGYERRAFRNERAPANGPKVALNLSVGRDDNVRPGDLVGALTNEGGLVGAEIGRIDILPRFSVVEVPQHSLESLFRNMERANIRGRRVSLRVAERWEFRAAPRAR